MKREELDVLIDGTWFGPYFTLDTVDDTTVKVRVDVRQFWPGGPSNLVGTTTLTPEMSDGQIVGQLLELACHLLVHELQEQFTIHGIRSNSPHKVALFRVGQKETPQ